MKNVILAGNSITADILHSYLSGDDRYKVVGLTVDPEFVSAGKIAGLETVALPDLATKHAPGSCVVIMAMGYADLNRGRESMFFRLKEMGYTIETYVHRDARVYSEHPLGEGCVVLPSAVIEPQVVVGHNTMIWCNTTLAHHCCVAENCWVASGAVISGQAVVERNTFIGVNATVVNKVVVAEFNIIGGGALITKNTKPSGVYLARSAEEFRFTSQDYTRYFGV